MFSVRRLPGCDVCGDVYGSALAGNELPRHLPLLLRCLSFLSSRGERHEAP